MFVDYKERKEKARQLIQRLTDYFGLSEDYFDHYDDVTVISYILSPNWLPKGRFVTSYKVAQSLKSRGDKERAFLNVLFKIRKLGIVSLDEDTIRTDSFKGKSRKAEYVIEDLFYELAEIELPENRETSLKESYEQWRMVNFGRK